MSVVIDASLIAKWLVNEPDSPAADILFVIWQLADVERLTPVLALAEVTNVLLKNVADGTLTLESGLSELSRVPQVVRMVEIGLAESRRALMLADAAGSRAVYDFYYVGLAEELDCELWTADAALWRSVRHSFPKVRLLGLDQVQAP